MVIISILRILGEASRFPNLHHSCESFWSQVEMIFFSFFSKEIRHGDYVNAITEASCVRPVSFRGIMNVRWRGRVDFTLFEAEATRATIIALFISCALLPPAWHAVANGTFKAPDNDDNPGVPLHGHPSIYAISRNLVRASRVSPVVHAHAGATGTQTQKKIC